jgi:hypothetical protein
MRQRNLIIRRFGAMSFGIGYFDDGVWIDHASMVPTDDPRLADVHAWYGCCERDAVIPNHIDGRIAVLPGVTAEPWGMEGAPAGDAALAN